MNSSLNYGKHILLGIAFALMIFAIFASLNYAPDPSEDSGFYAPKAQKIFYFHLPSAILSYVAFAITFGASVIYLKSTAKKWDIIASSSAEIGLIFCTLALITGALWGKAEWNAYWRWEDIRLDTFLILWLIFIGYLGIRNSVDEPEKRGRLAAVFGIVGFVGVPLSYFSMYIWQTQHPVVVSPGGGGLATEMRNALLISFAAFIMFYTYLLMKRKAIMELEERVEVLKDLIEGVENG